jgi:hypothetical protein
VVGETGYFENIMGAEQRAAVAGDLPTSVFDPTDSYVLRIHQEVHRSLQELVAGTVYLLTWVYSCTVCRMARRAMC